MKREVEDVPRWSLVIVPAVIAAMLAVALAGSIRLWLYVDQLQPASPLMLHPQIGPDPRLWQYVR